MVTAAITLFFAFQLPRARLDNNNMRFIPVDDEARMTSAWIDDTFGSSLFILIGLQRRYGTVFDAEFLKEIEKFSERIEEIEVVGELNSLMTSDYIWGDADTITVENLVPDSFSGTPEEIAELKRRINSWDMYDNSLVSADYSATQIYVPLTISAENAGDPEVIAVFLEIRDMAHNAFDSLADVYVTGIPVVSGTINEAMSADLIYLIPLVIVVILLVVYLPLRRFSLVMLSLLAVLVAAVWSVGAMPLFGIKLSIISTVLPVILIAVGNSYGLHVIVHYMEDSGKDFARMTKDEHTELVISSMAVVRAPIFLAALTTLVSFLAFCFTSVIPMREFGYFAAFGVFAAFILSIFLTPAILILRGPRPLKKAAGKTGVDRISYNDKIARILVRIVSHKWLRAVITVIVIVVSIYGATKLVTDNVFIEYFKDSTDIVKSEKFIREKFGGAKIVSVVAQADSPEIALHPDTLCAMDGLNRYLMEKIPAVGKVMGFTDLIKRTNQVFYAEGAITNEQVIMNNEQSGEDVFGFDGEDDFGFGFGFDEGEYADTTELARDSADFAPSEIVYTFGDMIRLLDNAASVDKNMNAARLVQELKKQVNYDGAAYYEIPADPARYGKATKEDLQRLVANYLVLLAGNDNSYSNDPLEPTAIKSTVQLRTLGQIDTDVAVKAIYDYVDAHFPANVTVLVGGAALVEGSTNKRVVQSVWTSMLIAFICLFIIVSVFNRSVFAGLIGVLPLLALVLFNFAVMGFAGIKLNIGTAMIASLTMGIGIDYTVHFLEAYKREAKLSGDPGVFLFKAYRTSGIAIVADAVSTGSGFAVLLLSQFVMLADFGLLIALSLLMSAIVGLIIVPLILNWAKPKFVTK